MLINKNTLCFLIILLPFLLTRLQFFLYYPIPFVSIDTFGYYAPIVDLEQGRLPFFGLRPIVYPFFLWIGTLFLKSNLAIIIVQNLIRFLTAWLLFQTLKKEYPNYRYFWAIAISVFINSFAVLAEDVSLTTESLYVSAWLLLLFSIIRMIYTEQMKWYLLSSFFLFTIILIKPMGLYLLVAIFLLMFLLYFYTRNIKKILINCIFLILLFLSYSSYNYLSGNFFGLTAFGQANFTGVIISFLEKNNNFNPCINQAIEQVQTQTHTERTTVAESSDPEVLYGIFTRIYNQNVLLDEGISKFCGTNHAIGTVGYNSDRSPIIRHALEQNPNIYTKFVYTNLYFYFLKNSLYSEKGRYDPFNRKIANNYAVLKEYNQIQTPEGLIYQRQRDLAWEKKALISYQKNAYVLRNQYFSDSIIPINNQLKDLPKQMAKFVRVDTLIVEKEGETILPYMREYPDNYEKTVSGEIELFVQTKRLNTYAIIFWRFMGSFFAAEWFKILAALSIWVLLFYSIYQIVLSKFTNKTALVAFFISVSYLGQAFLVCLSEIALPRYSNTLEFVKYFSLVFLWIFFQNRHKPCVE